MNIFKLTAGALIFLILYAVQNPQAIENIDREMQIYDSIQHPYRYADEVTEAELKSMEEDRIFEGKPYKKKEKGGKEND